MKPRHKDPNPYEFAGAINGRERQTVLESSGAPSVRERWPWVEPCAWSQRMLTALEKGVNEGKWFSLIDKVYRRECLRVAFKKTKAKRGAPGVDRVTVQQFEGRLEENLEYLENQLCQGRYQPQAVKRIYIPKAPGKGKRPVGIPTVRDRVVQRALKQVLEPIFERDFAERSYGFRPGRGCKEALRRVEELLRDGSTWVVDADLQGYFDSIPHERLMGRIEEKVADGKVLALIEAYLHQGILEEMKYWTPEKGTPQGAVLSPLLANVYLDPLDHLMAQEGFEMVRYADDFVILCRSESEARRALRIITDWTQGEGLQLHPDKTQLVDVTQAGGFDFLGYHFERGRHWVSRKSLRKHKDSVRAKTKRCNAHSLEEIIAKINPILRGWYGYFQHSYHTTFPYHDGWVRMRLRSILRKRAGRKGRGRGKDHQRWPNAYFAERGLFSLSAAHTTACQSARR